MNDSLLYSIDKQKLIKFIKSFTEATDIAVDINDYNGYPVVFNDCFFGFCKKVRETKKGYAKCIESNAEIGYQISKGKKAFMSPCFAGIPLMGVPVLVNDRFQGSIVCGQFHLENPTNKTINNMIKAIDAIGMNGEDLVEDFKSIKVIDQEKCTAAAELIGFISSYIAEIIYHNQTEQELNNKKIKLMEATQKRTELEKSLLTSELKKLQSQIKPHFLFNTLNTLSRLVLLDNKDKALKTVYALSNLLRQSFDDSKEMLPLSLEIDYVKDYLAIQKIRFGDRLSYEFNVEQDVSNISIPSFIIQPIVENACIHGIEPKEKDGKIIVYSFKSKSHIIFKVEDNGIGISSEKLIKLNQGLFSNTQEKGSGLRNVNRRLQLYYGNEYYLNIKSEENRFTEVSFKIPLKKGKVDSDVQSSYC